MKWAPLAIAAALFLSVSTASAASLDLDSWAFYVDGSTYQSQLGDVLPGSFSTGGFNFATGLGIINVTITGAGSHAVDSFFDIEIDQFVNGSGNEAGLVSGGPAAGQSWEIDEPGYVFGDIYANALTNALDNTNAVPLTNPDDVAMAQGWNFALAANQYAVVSFQLSDVIPQGGFFLTQLDPDSQAAVYFRSTLSIRETGPNVIPEPMTMVGCLLGLGAVTRYVRKRRA
jgi:hypothetical protein